jgi:NAD+ kinase
MTFGIIGNINKLALRNAVSSIMAKLRISNQNYVIENRIVELLDGDVIQLSSEHCGTVQECVERADILVVFGGDGTIIAVARSVGSKETPILGINLGRLGFLAEFAPVEMEQAIDDILNKRYIIEERLALEATFPRTPGKIFHALNDIIMGKSGYTRLIDLETHIDGAFAVRYRADGLVIATPTGSTAYSFSNGGPIVIPTSRVISIAPIAPHTLSGRPLIVPDGSTIRVIVQSEGHEVLVSADGQVEETIKPPVEVVVRHADYKVKLVKRVGRSYFEVLRAKLLWGQDPRSSAG